MNRSLIMSGNYKNYVKLSEINQQVQKDPQGFVEECEYIYDSEIERAAQMIAERIQISRIVMLAGPSGSGKTTTASRIRECLKTKGIQAHNIGMDDYFLDVDRENPSINYEAPERLDLQLIIQHMEQLEKGEDVWLPSFNFITGKQTKNVRHMKLGPDEVAIFEGIHALNDCFRTPNADPTDIYVSARMRITKEDENVLVEPEQTRFLRRGVRDANFRGADFNRTLELWHNVLLGEQEYIMPFKKYADIMIDTSFDYEVNLLAQFAIPQLSSINQEGMTVLGMGNLADVLQQFIPVSPSYIPEKSILREFIGNIGLPQKS